MSFVNLYLDDKKLPNVMAAPLTQTKIADSSGGSLSYQTVNDYGGLTSKVNLELK